MEAAILMRADFSDYKDPERAKRILFLYGNELVSLGKGYEALKAVGDSIDSEELECRLDLCLTRGKQSLAGVPNGHIPWDQDAFDYRTIAVRALEEFRE